MLKSLCLGMLVLLLFLDDVADALSQFHDAARTVFKQVVKDYPDSDRAREAEQKLQSLGVG